MIAPRIPTVLLPANLVFWPLVDGEKLRLYAGVHSWNPGCLEAERKDGRWLMIMGTSNFCSLRQRAWRHDKNKVSGIAMMQLMVWLD